MKECEVISNRTLSLARTIATLGPVGYVPLGPGTAGALVTVVAMFLAVGAFGPAVWAPAFLLVLILGQWACSAIRKEWGDDPSRVIIDEVAGQLLAVAFVEPRSEFFLAGFVLFRLFDIWKPGPIRLIEDRAGKWSIMGDDLAAGALARVVLFFLIRIYCMVS